MGLSRAVVTSQHAAGLQPPRTTADKGTGRVRILPRHTAMRCTNLFPLLVAALALSTAGSFAQPAPLPPIRVHLVSLGRPGRVVIQGAGLRATDSTSGDAIAEGGDSVTVVASRGELEVGEKHVAGLRVEAPALTVEARGAVRHYPHAMLLTPSRGGIALVNECSLDEYTTGVLAGECPPLFHPEAIKAMAVAVRSYSYRKAYLRDAELCDTTHCQVYRGLNGVAESQRQAVQATSGLCAVYQGEVIDAVYCSDCGGHTENNENAWRGAHPQPYLRGVEDSAEPEGQPYCASSRFHTWRFTVSSSRLRSLLGIREGSPKLSIRELSETGRVRRLVLSTSGAASPPETSDPAGADGENPDTDSRLASAPSAKERVFSGVEWRRLFGAARVKSLHFDVRPAPDGVEIVGQGWGHGVGLCQFGANGMAKQGVPFDEILKHYYTGVQVAPAPSIEDARAAMLRNQTAPADPEPQPEAEPDDRPVDTTSAEARHRSRSGFASPRRGFAH